MKKDYEKRVIHNFNIYNTDEIEAYLENMATKGYYLLEMNEHQMFFQKGESSHVRYTVMIEENKAKQWEIQKVMEQAGYQYICSVRHFLIFVTKKLNVTVPFDDFYRYESVRALKEKVVFYHFLKIALLVFFCYLVFDWKQGVFSIFLSTIELSTFFATVSFCFLLLTEMIGISYWNKVSKKSLEEGRALQFRFPTIINAIRYIFRVLLVINVTLVAVLSIQSFIVHAEGVGKRGFYALLYLVLLVIAWMIGSLVRKEYRKRGFWERKLAEIGLILIVSLSVTGLLNKGGKEDNMQISSNMVFEAQKSESYTDIEQTSSIFGKREVAHVISFDKEGKSIGDYRYYLFESKIPWLTQQIKSNFIKNQKLQDQLLEYDKKNNVKIYTALAKDSDINEGVSKFQPESMEFYKHCIVMSKENKFLVFYYDSVEPMKEEVLIKYLQENVVY